MRGAIATTRARDRRRPDVAEQLADGPRPVADARRETGADADDAAAASSERSRATACSQEHAARRLRATPRRRSCCVSGRPAGPSSHTSSAASVLPRGRRSTRAARPTFAVFRRRLLGLARAQHPDGARRLRRGDGRRQGDARRAARRARLARRRDRRRRRRRQRRVARRAARSCRPRLRGIVFDLPETDRDEIALRRAARLRRRGASSRRCRAATPTSSRAILHDWDDERAAAILRTIRAARSARRAAARRSRPSSRRGTSRTARSGSTCSCSRSCGRERDEAQWRTLLASRVRAGEIERRADRAQMPLTVGTAGHIDHGKTWLVAALTGKDTDRLPEEQERGISIDLGYAPLDLPDGTRLSVVDVPGHERFVRTMVAGATGIDLFLLVIDAAEGARPQTHEHLAILRLLGVDRGVVARDEGGCSSTRRRSSSRSRRRASSSRAPVVAVSAKHRRRARRAARRARARSRADASRAARRRRRGSTSTACSRLRGIGTVATGTLWSGSNRQTATSCASSRRDATSACAACRCTTARSSAAEAGQRVAVALPGVERRRAPPRRRARHAGRVPRGYRLDVALEELARDPVARARPPRHRRVALARVVRVGERCAQLRLAAARRRRARRPRRAPRRHDRRRRTVLDPAPPRHASASDGARRARRIARRCTHRPVESLDTSERRRLVRGDWVSQRGWTSCGELERGSPRRTRSTRASRRPPSRGRRELVPLLGLERRGAKLYRPGADGELGARAQEADALEAAARARAGEGRGRSARPLPRGAGPARPRRRRLRRLALRRTSRRARRSSPSASAAGWSRSRASATCSASAQDGAAAARALRRRRAHAPRRRRARAQARGCEELKRKTSGRW